MSRRQGGLDEELAEHLRARLKRAIFIRGWTLTRLARESGVSQPAIGAFLAGQSSPKPETIGKLARAIRRVPPDPDLVELLGELEAEPEPAQRQP